MAGRGTSLEKSRMGALRIINSLGCGYMTTLKSRVEESLIEEFISVGFIVCGYTRANKTWRISELGKNFYSELQ